MSNTTAISELGKTLNLIFSYTSLVEIVVGILGNLTIFLVLRLNKKFKAMTSMIYLSFIAITDTISLLYWNLSHFLTPMYNKSVDDISPYMCQLGPFYQFSSLQSSSLLLTIMSIDRYFIVCRMPGSIWDALPFRTVRSAYCWSIGIISSILIANSHLLFMPRALKPVLNAKNGSNVTKYRLDCFTYRTGFEIFPKWEMVHLFLYSIIPFSLMIIFNALLIKNTLWSYFLKTKNELFHMDANRKKGLRKKQMITISLILISMFYLVTTLPTSIIFGFFYDFFAVVLSLDKSFFVMLDNIAFLNNSFRFLLLLVANPCFRKAFFKFWKRLYFKLKQ
jgi:hypothetical protein